MAKSKTRSKGKSPQKVVSRDKSLKKDGTPKKARKFNDMNFKPYIHKVLKQIYANGEYGISSRGMTVMNDFVIDIFQRIAGEASKLAMIEKNLKGPRGTKTITSRHIQTATRFQLQGELAKHAVSEGTKAVTIYWRNKD